MENAMDGAVEVVHCDDGTTMQVRRLSDVMGAEVIGVDLSKPLGPALRHAILSAFLEHHLLAFRNQNLAPEQQHAFTLEFGEIEEHVARLPDGEKLPLVHVVSNLDRDGRPTTKPHSTGNYFWHTDKSYHDRPSLATLLHAVELPPDGGDTLFCNTYKAYESLPEDRKHQLAGMNAIHSWEASRRNTGNAPATEQQIRERPPVSHPVVRTHPDTGRKLLYIGSHTSHIEGMPEPEGKALLDELLEHAAQPQHIYRHQWRKGDLCMWDNRCLLHKADSNYDMATHRRILHRTVVRGDVPY
jgi:taurine dioxygenase